MFDAGMADLDPAATLTEASAARAAADLAEVRLLQLAAHWADLHDRLHPADAGVSLPGRQRLVRLGGPGTPTVAEFAPAELGAELALSPYAAGRLIGTALDLRHRLPKLWAVTQAGQVRPWVARKAAETTRDLPPELIEQLDARLARWAPRLSWGRLDALIAAFVIEADPAAAAQAAREAEGAQGVWLGRGSDCGIKDIFIRTETSIAIWFDAPSNASPSSSPPSATPATATSAAPPMTRFHHRIKTHSRWQVRQPFPGVYLWRTLHGRYHLVDHTGTHRAA